MYRYILPVRVAVIVRRYRNGVLMVVGMDDMEGMDCVHAMSMRERVMNRTGDMTGGGWRWTMAGETWTNDVLPIEPPVVAVHVVMDDRPSMRHSMAVAMMLELGIAGSWMTRIAMESATW